MKALGIYVVVKPDEFNQKREKGGFVIEKDDIRYVYGEIVSFGDMVKGIKKGDRVSFDDRAGHFVNVDGEKLKVIKYGDIAFVV